MSETKKTYNRTGRIVPLTPPCVITNCANCEIPLHRKQSDRREVLCDPCVAWDGVYSHSTAAARALEEANR